MTDDVNAKLDALHAEIKALRQEQAATRRVINAATMRHSWAKHLVSDLETNPHTQYKVHLYGVIYWLINFPAICYLFFGQPTLWTKLGIFITLVYSIYANFATDYGAMSAAMAAFGDKPPPEIPLQAEHDG